MVNAQQWLDQNYPSNGTCINQKDKENCIDNKRRRGEINNLDISNKNLEGSLNLTDFIHLLKLNISFNNLTHFYPCCTNDPKGLIYVNNEIKEVYCSHNNFNTDWGTWEARAMKILDFSNNNVNSYILIAPSLTHLNASKNNLNKLDLSEASQSLIELNCSGNTLAGGLNLTDAPNLISFDCLKTKLFTSTTTVMPSPHDPNNPLVIGLGTGFSTTSLLLISTLCKHFLGKWFCFI